MFINQANRNEKMAQTVGTEQTKVKTPGICDQQSVFDFEKIKESYKMTEQGSFFMPNAVYQKPEGKDETALDNLDTQMDMTAANRKNQMVVITNTASPEDLEKMSQDGFDCMDRDSHTIVTVTDKIKAVLAKAGVDVSIYGDDLSTEQLEKMTGNAAVATQIKNALKSADLPVTAENIAKIKDADMEVQRLFQNLTPAVTLELIRKGENPLDMEISQLNQIVETMQADTGEKEQERFSKYLWK